MTQNTRTEWFPADISPVRAGLYECERGVPREGEMSRLLQMLHWDGAGWSYPNHHMHAAMYVSQGDKWRGLTKTSV